MRRLLAVLLVLVTAACSSYSANPGADQRVLINRAAATVERLRKDPNFQANLQPRLDNARAVMIVPSLVKGGFIVGGEYGGAVLLARLANGGWSSPAFYQMAGGSLGLQLGVQDASTMLIIMSDKGLDAVMNNKFKSGAEASVAVFTEGGGIEAATTANMGADIFAFSRNVGIFGGASLDGVAVTPRYSWNQAYYGIDNAYPGPILQGQVQNPQADRLKDLLSR